MKQKIKERKIEKKKRREIKNIKRRQEEAAFARLQKAARSKGTTIRKNNILNQETN